MNSSWLACGSSALLSSIVLVTLAVVLANAHSCDMTTTSSMLNSTLSCAVGVQEGDRGRIPGHVHASQADEDRDEHHAGKRHAFTRRPPQVSRGLTVACKAEKNPGPGIYVGVGGADDEYEESTGGNVRKNRNAGKLRSDFPVFVAKIYSRATKLHSCSM
ncbi:hypothetical protein GMORB2_4236 [Geosmithia morbida]|uniref:Secreted protein n=1 Tax=Geosmithia morbida TaxID=1094350 RepID=A0A9P4Z0X7_9HYPO|nr:uncharacterized protein GMORB2_4236 [Geosmithia morbida]KAF4125396.1 hypothetical protein GMORB2_4236 [Geosmithia morbida]